MGIPTQRSMFLIMFEKNKSGKICLQAGGLCRDLPISTMLTITVLMPFPLPST